MDASFHLVIYLSLVLLQTNQHSEHYATHLPNLSCDGLVSVKEESGHVNNKTCKLLGNPINYLMKPVELFVVLEENVSSKIIYSLCLVQG